MAAPRLDPRWFIAPTVAFLGAVLGVVAGAEPKIAIVLSLAIAFVVIAFANFPLGLAVFGFLGFIEVVPSGGPFLSVTKLTGLLLAMSWFAIVTTDAGSRRNFITAQPLATMLLVLFLGWTALSATWSLDPAAAYGSFGRFFLNGFLFLIVFTGVRDRDDAVRLACAFILGAATAAAYGIFASTSVDADRLGSDVLDPNELAAVLVAGAALAVAVLAAARDRPGTRVFAIVTGTFCLTAVLLTLSRGGLVALGAALIGAILIGGRWRAPIVVGVLALTVGVVVYFADFAGQESRDRVTHVTQGQNRLAEGRSSLWQIAWRAVEDHPVEGVGGGNFPVTSRQYLLEPGLVPRADEILRNRVVHNAYLEVFSELGLVGLSLYVLIIVFSLGTLLRASRVYRVRGDPAMQAFSLGVAVALIGNLIADFFISGEYSKQLWLLMALGPALLGLAEGLDEPTAEKDRESRSAA